MNKYQREKAKRMKKLGNLGVGYYSQKKLLRQMDFEHVDFVIDQLTRMKEPKYQNIFKKLSRKVIKIFKRN
jgi:hypothetical protein